MKTLSNQDVQRAVADALESIAFLLADSSQGTDTSLDLHARIPFTGPGEESTVTLSASEGFLIELASNMLGAEPEEVQLEVEGLQALTELANMICGEVVLLLGAQDLPYRIGLPTALDGIEQSSTAEDRLEVNLGTDEGCLRVRVQRTSTS